jgi:hypothetical protein
MTNTIPTNPHEMRVVTTQYGTGIRAVYTDKCGKSYVIVDGKRVRV